MGGDVVAIVPDGNGGYFIAGSFTTVAGVPRRSVARLTAAGAVDPAFAATAIDRAINMVLSGDRLFVSGYRELDSFSGIVALDRVTGALLPWTPENPTAPAGLFALPNGNLVATWEHLGPPYPPATNIEIDRSTGAMVTFWPARPLVTVDEDTVVGSVFYSIYRVNVHTRAATPLISATQTGCKPGGPVCSYLTRMALRARTLFVAGAFTTIGGAARAGTAAINVDSGELLPWQAPPISNFRAVSVHLDVAQLIVQYVGDAGHPSALVACDFVSGAATGWRGWLLGGGAQAAFGEPTRVVVGGEFRGAGGVPRTGLAAVRWPDGRPTEWRPDVGMTPRTIATLGSRIFVAGSQSLNYRPGWIREVDSTTGSVAAWSVPFDETPAAMRALGERLFVAGDFKAIAGIARSYLASLNVSGSTPVLEPWAPAVSSSFSNFSVITSLDVSPQVVMIAGQLTAVGGQARWGVAAVDSRSGAPYDWAPQLGPQYPSGNRYFVEIAANRVWVSGSLVSVNGQSRAGIAAFDLQGVLTPWSPQQPDYGRNLNGFEQHAWYFEDRLYSGVGYSVEASDGSLTSWVPDFDSNVTGGSWAAAPGLGLVRYDMFHDGFLLFPRDDLPGAVGGLRAAISGNTVTLSWLAASRASSYVLEVGSTAGAADVGQLTVDANTTALTLSGPDGRYFVRVRAHAVGGLSTVSDDLVIVLGPAGCGAPPSPPAALRADSAGPRVRLEWQLPPGAFGTIIEASLDGGGSYLEVVRLAGVATRFDAQAPPGRYLARVRASNACGTGMPSAPVTVVTAAVTTPPSAPANLQGSVFAGRRVALSWQPSSGLPIGYVVAVGSAPACRT
jgi:hypothetical protein